MKLRILPALLFLLPGIHVPAAGLACHDRDTAWKSETACENETACESSSVETAVRNEQRLKISGGPSAAFLSSSFIHSPMDDGRSLMKYGCSIGGFVDMGIKEWFSIQFELALVYDMSEFTRLGETGTYRHAGLELPIYAMFHLRLEDRGQFNLGAGPFTDFGLYGSYETASVIHDVYARDESTGLSTMKDNYSGIAVKAGYEFRFGLQLNCCYRVSLSNVLDENSSTVRMHPQTASFEIAYRF